MSKWDQIKSKFPPSSHGHLSHHPHLLDLELLRAAPLSHNPRKENSAHQRKKESILNAFICCSVTENQQALQPRSGVLGGFLSLLLVVLPALGQASASAGEVALGAVLHRPQMSSYSF